MPRSLKDESQDTIFDELVATEAALAADDLAKPLAPQVGEQIDQWEEVTKAQRQASRKETAAKAVATVRDAELDDAVIEFGDDLYKAVKKDRKSPRFRRYFKQSPARFVRMERLKEATTVQTWVPSIQKEPEPYLAAHAGPLEAKAEASINALNAAATAAGEKASDRVRLWDTYVKALDGFRAVLHADLVKLGEANGKHKDWPDRFFKTASRNDSAPNAELVADAEEPEGQAGGDGQ